MEIVANQQHTTLGTLMTEPTLPFAAWASAEIERLEARVAELEKATASVLEASDEFRAGMGPEWEGDPLTDACDELRAVIAKESCP
jgi:hypothetical protein